MTDRDFLIWIHERLVKVYNEDPLLDYMHRLRGIIYNAPTKRTSYPASNTFPPFKVSNSNKDVATMNPLTAVIAKVFLITPLGISRLNTTESSLDLITIIYFVILNCKFTVYKLIFCFL